MNLRSGGLWRIRSFHIEDRALRYACRGSGVDTGESSSCPLGREQEVLFFVDRGAFVCFSSQEFVDAGRLRRRKELVHG